MSYSSGYLDTLRLQEEGRALIATWALEKKDLSKEDPRSLEIDEQIAKISAGILQLESLLRSMERNQMAEDSKRAQSNHCRHHSLDQQKGCMSAVLCFFSYK